MGEEGEKPSKKAKKEEIPHRKQKENGIGKKIIIIIGVICFAAGIWDLQTPLKKKIVTENEGSSENYPDASITYILPTILAIIGIFFVWMGSTENKYLISGILFVGLSGALSLVVDVYVTTTPSHEYYPHPLLDGARLALLIGFILVIYSLFKEKFPLLK